MHEFAPARGAQLLGLGWSEGRCKAACGPTGDVAAQVRVLMEDLAAARAQVQTLGQELKAAEDARDNATQVRHYCSWCRNVHKRMSLA